MAQDAQDAQDDRTRILIADCHPFESIHYKRVLGTQSDFVVVGVAEDGLDAVNKALELSPDVAIIDVFLPKLDGVRAALQILEHRPQTAIVMLSSRDDPELVKALINKEPKRKAFLLKDSLTDVGDLIRTVSAVAKGQTVLDLNIVRKLARHYVNHSLFKRLTDVERKVVALLSTGVENRAIADSLGIALSEVAGYTDSIYKKLPKLPGGGHLPLRIQAVLSFVQHSTSTEYEVSDEASDESSDKV